MNAVATLAAQADAYEVCLRRVAQSVEIHPDWDLAAHLADLDDEFGFEPDTILAHRGWLTGWTRERLDVFVAHWLKFEDRLAEWVSNT